MKAIQKYDGGVIISAREYDIASNTNIKQGTVVKLSAGKVVQAVAGETGAILGIAAENHPGAMDALNPRANGTKIMVVDCPDAVLASPAAVVEATGGSATTVTASTLGAYSNDDFNGGFLKLVEKAAASTNTDPIGTVKEITDYAYNSTGTVSTFTVASGGAANAGDKYELYPPVGLAKGALNSTFDAIVHTGVSCTVFKVIGRMIEQGIVLWKAVTHF